ncbi:response regulator [Actomonas aquatica]|uniref:histidine kinase n=1 Tax=Actomonas aquatica TaxID=2866162 RepID=A0ABZ1C8C8_9BACT|nr:response regulator [Opitutus sp. WL0086]WRQ87721.1 ATP-binding protein [Opitutus sp. WL0086]
MPGAVFAEPTSQTTTQSPARNGLPPPNWRNVAVGVGLHLLLFAGVIASAFIAMRLISLPPTNVTVVWLPAGIAVVALRGRIGLGGVPTLFLAHWAVIALANNYDFLGWRPLSLIMAAANTAGPALGAWIWNRWVKQEPFEEPFDFLRFVFGVAFLPSLLTAWVIPTVIVSTGHLPGATLVDVVQRISSITFSSSLGVFLVAPIALGRWEPLPPAPLSLRWSTNLANLGLALAIAILGFHLSLVGLYLAIPYALAASVICGVRGLGLGLFVFILYGLLETSFGEGMFASPQQTPLTNLVEMAAAALCLGVPAHFAGLTLRRLRRQQNELEQIVADRTQDLRASEESYRLATDLGSVGVYRWENGTVHPAMNQELRKQLRHIVRPGRLHWPRVWRHLHPEDRPHAREILRDILRNRSDVFCVDARMRLRTGEWKWFQTRGRVLQRDARNRPVRLVGTVGDIDQERSRVLALTAARDQANARTQAKDAFLANISHEIRTPMHAMLGFTRVLEGTELSPKQAECVQAISSSGGLLLELVNDLLDLSRIEAGVIALDPQVTALEPLVRESVQLFEEAATTKQLRLRSSVDPDLPSYLELDRTRLRQVISNLVSNAVKFTVHGSVEVRVSGKPLTSGPRRAAGQSWLLRLEVLDTGIGIDPRHISRLFHPFAQADATISRRFGGTGLGLALSRRLCELMGGTITVSSLPGTGSAFSASFRATSAAAPAGSSADGSAVEQAPPRGLRILVVEDDRLNRRLAEMLLQKLGHHPHFAFNGLLALEKLEEEGFDLVLMDLKMPELDGIETTQRIRAAEKAGPPGRHVPIIALTANAGQDERKRCLDAGMDEYLTKPLDLSAFTQTLLAIRDRFGFSSQS